MYSPLRSPLQQPFRITQSSIKHKFNGDWPICLPQCLLVLSAQSPLMTSSSKQASNLTYHRALAVHNQFVHWSPCITKCEHPRHELLAVFLLLISPYHLLNPLRHIRDRVQVPHRILLATHLRLHSILICPLLQQQFWHSQFGSASHTYTQLFWSTKQNSARICALTRQSFCWWNKLHVLGK